MPVAREDVQGLRLEQRGLEELQGPGPHHRVAGLEQAQVELDLGQELEQDPVALEQIAQGLVTLLSGPRRRSPRASVISLLPLQASRASAAFLITWRRSSGLKGFAMKSKAPLARASRATSTVA